LNLRSEKHDADERREPPMNAEDLRVFLDAITGRIIGAAQTVSATLGVGFLERVYENALLIELRTAGLKVAAQLPLKVHYAGQVVGEYVADMLIEDSVLVELKAQPEIGAIHRAQCLNYLRATGLKVCLLLNFGKPKLEIKRIVCNF
jgi:GxxExxY protein